MNCTTEFDVTTHWKDTTIVYGILNLQDTAHYIRVQRAYLDPRRDANQIASHSDSIYYDSLVVQLVDKNLGITDTLRKVDGRDEGLPKEDGLFSDRPNWLYKSTATLDPKTEYELVIEIPQQQKTVRASTRLVHSLYFLSPNDSSLWSGTQPLLINWYPANHARTYQAIVSFYYKEFNFNFPGQTFYPDPVVWKLFRFTTNPSCGSRFCYEFKVNQIIGSIAGRIPYNPDVRRTVDYISLDFVAGGEALNAYEQSQIARDFSIAQLRTIIPYSNIDEGEGLFSSRLDATFNRILLANAINDSIANDPRSNHLGF